MCECAGGRFKNWKWRRSDEAAPKHCCVESAISTLFEAYQTDKKKGLGRAGLTFIVMSMAALNVGFMGKQQATAELSEQVSAPKLSLDAYISVDPQGKLFGCNTDYKATGSQNTPILIAVNDGILDVNCN